ncbi:hypothetical protein E4U32_002319 [Claviceps aff. humidiphila group G2b]|nr:hypothetical protein E4U32_002319 [Claviceps aff. humidiphila group G2b]
MSSRVHNALLSQPHSLTVSQSHSLTVSQSHTLTPSHSHTLKIYNSHLLNHPFSVLTGIIVPALTVPDSPAHLAFQRTRSGLAHHKAKHTPVLTWLNHLEAAGILALLE